MPSHVDFVGALFVIWGLLTTLVGVSTLALGFGAVALIMSASRGGEGGQVAAGMTAAAFTVLGLIAIVWGIAHVVVGVPVRRRQALCAKACATRSTAPAAGTCSGIAATAPSRT